MPRNSLRSFTLVELLIVIAILAILAAAVVIVLNPAELLAQARDSQRVTDLKNIKKSIDLFVVDNPTVSLGTASRVYISLPDTASNCPNLTSSLPTLPSGWQYVCATSANLRNTNGSGWIPVNFGSVFGGSPIPYLPIDPSNDLSSGRYYTYVMGGSYELTALMEAAKENVSVNDGGSLPGVFQVGTHIDLTPPTRDKGLVGYWTFDGALGSITNGQTAGLSDSSGRGNNGVASNAGGTGMAFVTGQVGNAVQFDGADDYVNAGNTSYVENFTTGAWINSGTDVTTYRTIISKSSSSADRNYWMNLRTDSGYLDERFSVGSAGRTFYTSTALNDNIWHYVAVTYNKAYVRLYVDGVMLTETAQTGSPDNPSANCLIGKYGSYAFIGLIDDVRVYDRALSASEIKAIYDATK